MISRTNTEKAKQWIWNVARQYFEGADNISLVWDGERWYVMVRHSAWDPWGKKIDGGLAVAEVIDEIPGFNNSGIKFVDPQGNEIDWSKLLRKD